MEKCEWCEEYFDRDDAEEYFNSETMLLSYDNVRKCLCGKCAVEAIEDKADGVYFETCEKCGQTFDLIEDESTFDDHFSWCNGTSLRDYWKDQILCADCAIEVADSEDDDEEYEDDDDEDNSENLSVYEAAQIWASHGKDEDYTFGYTEDELEDAL